MISTLLLILVMVLLYELTKHHQDKHTCRYCGGYRGHGQNCPYDFEHREQR